MQRRKIIRKMFGVVIDPSDIHQNVDEETRKNGCLKR